MSPLDPRAGPLPRRAHRKGPPSAGAESRRQRGPNPHVEPRDLAARLLASIQTRHAFSDKLMASEFRRADYPPATRARVNRLVKGVLRRRGEIDGLLEQRLAEKFAGLPLLMRQILRLGVYQMLDESGIPRPMVVSETVELARKYGHPGTVGMVNAVLRRISETPDLRSLLPQGDTAAALAARLSHPQWMVERWLGRFGPARTERLLAANQEERPTFLRPNPFHGGLEALERELKREEVAFRVDAATGLVRVDSRFAPPDSPAFNSGHGTIQDPAEFLVVRLCGAGAGQRWLDLCSAPGGKTTGLAECMDGHGRVVGADLHLSRLRRARETAQRLGTPGIDWVAADGRRPPFRAAFDGVLVDAPCSGLGVLARKADARWRKEPGILATLPATQRALLEAAAPLLGRGGVLVYSVCSFEPEETSDLVAAFLAAHPEFRKDDVSGRLPEGASADGCLLSVPGAHDMDGAFAARMIRS